MRQLKGIFYLVAAFAVSGGAFVLQRLAIRAGKVHLGTLASIAVLGLLFLGLWIWERGRPQQALSFHERLRRQGKRGLARSAERSLSRDWRLPILVLRSFEDDERFFLSPPGSWFRNFGRRVRDTVSLEQLVELYLRDAGPVVAIGKPGEWAPALGAARLYAGDEWRDRINELIWESQLVTVFLGRGDGLGWEIDRLFDSAVLQKTVLVIPPSEPQDRHERWSRFVGQAWRHGVIWLPEQLPDTARFVTFDGETRCQIWESTKRNSPPASTCSDDYESALQQAFADGSRIQLRRVRWYSMSLKFKIVFFSIFGVLGTLTLIGVLGALVQSRR
jgi:hypothetical protein